MQDRTNNFFTRKNVDYDGYLSGFDLSARKVLSKDLSASVGYQYWMENAKSSFLSNDTNVFYGALSKKLAEDLTMRVTGALSWSDYNEGSPAFGNRPREDVRKRFSVSLHKNISDGKELFVEYVRTVNDSNLGLYEFERSQIMTGMRLKF